MADPNTHARTDHALLVRVDEQLIRRTAGAFIAGYDSAATRVAYQGDLRTYFAWCETVGVDPMTAGNPEITIYARWLGDRLAPSTQHRRIGTVRGWYEWLSEHGYRSGVNPCWKVRLPRVTTVRPGTALSEVQTARLLEASHAHSTRLHAVVALGIYDGLRIGEICGNLNLGRPGPQIEDRGRERYHHTLKVLCKNGKRFTIPLCGPVIEALDDHLAERGNPTSGPLIVNGQGRPISRNNVRQMLERLCAKVGLPRITPHDLRRTVITMLFRAKVPVSEIQRFAHHEDPSTTMRYDLRRRSMDEHLSHHVVRLTA